jgi:hypothetical protein
MGHDDPRLRWHRLYGVSAEVKSRIAGRLILKQQFLKLRSPPSGRHFYLLVANEFNGEPSMWTNQPAVSLLISYRERLKRIEMGKGFKMKLLQKPKDYAFSVFFGVALTLTFATAASSAVVVSIGFEWDGNGIVSVGGTKATEIFFAPFGTFDFNVATATSAPVSPFDLLDSTALNVTTNVGTHTFNVFVTAQNLTSPTGLSAFTSSFTENNLPAGFSVTEQSFIDAGNGVFALTTPLSSITFLSNGTSVQTALADTGGGAYSLTEEYTLNVSGPGSATSTIEVSPGIAAVPEVSTWAMMILGFASVGFMAYRRRAMPRLLAA